MRSQDFIVDELIVVVDDSDDETEKVAREMGAKVIMSGPIPAGWLGKPWACYRGANASSSGSGYFSGRRHLPGA
ncbi:hypothetical protein ACFLXC_00715 [Chloroflexota bacterium]